MIAYPHDTNAFVHADLEGSGFGVAATAPFFPASTTAEAGLDRAGVIHATITMATTDRLWIPCGDVRALALIGKTESATCRPCGSGRQALLEVASAHLGIAG